MKKHIGSAYEHENYDPQRPYEFQNVSSSQQLINIIKTDLDYNHKGYIETNNNTFLEQAESKVSISDSLLQFLKYEFIEPDSRAFLVQSTESIYESIIDLYYKLYQKTKEKKYLDLIYRYMERSNNLFLFEFINERDVSSFGIPNALLIKKDSLLDSLRFFKEKITSWDSIPSSIQEKLDNYQNAYHQHLSHIQRDYPQYYKNLYFQDDKHITDIQSSLKPNQLIIEYFLGKFGLYTMYIGNKYLSIDYNNISTGFNEDIRNLMHLIQGNQTNDARYHELITSLSNQLINTEKVSNYEELIIIPDDDIGLVSFDLLKTGDHYLLDKHTIRYDYASSIIMNKKSNSRYKNRVAFAPLTKGDIINQLDTFQQLKYSDNELDFISEIKHMRIYKDSLANETTFKKAALSSSVLHLATHGFSEILPEYSHLIFSNRDDTLNDGILYAYEIINMPLDVDLTVLSACNTGSGTIQKGQGMNTLGKAFAYAGSDSEVVNLWQVDDLINSQLIGYFYDGLEQGENKSVALRNAKLKFLSEAPDYLKEPYYWAGLVLYGSDVPLSQENTLWY